MSIFTSLKLNVYAFRYSVRRIRGVCLNQNLDTKARFLYFYGVLKT
jgi:hypothetical protein